jgi:hypothetical protein
MMTNEEKEKLFVLHRLWKSSSLNKKQYKLYIELLTKLNQGK